MAETSEALSVEGAYEASDAPTSSSRSLAIQRRMPNKARYVPDLQGSPLA